MSNWAENPEHQRKSLMSFALPQLLFTECHKYCVEVDFLNADTPEQKKCIANCQDKTYKAFDLYMEVNKRFAARKTYRSYVDISKFTDMEVEHKHDTENVISHVTDGHVHPDALKDFTRVVDRDLGDFQKSALK